MTADIRTAAQREAGQLRVTSNGREYGMAKLYKVAFVDGAVWAQARVTPTQAQVESAILGRTATAGAKAVLALLAELAEGEMIET